MMPLTSTCGPLPTAGGSTSFLHAFDGSPIEQRLVAAASRVHCGNSELYEVLRVVRPDIQELFCPGTILSPQRFQRTELSVFTFGMAHKIRVPLYRRLYDLLEATGQSYSVYVSTALHENTSFDDSFIVRFEELQAIFNGQVYFMGYLSDTAVYNQLIDCTFLAAFFEKGLRANNTSVNAAMECGCAVITNLDEHSPRGLVHMKNVIDINQSDRLPDADLTQRIGSAAREIAHARVRMGPARRAVACRRSDIGRSERTALRGDHNLAGTLKIGKHEIGDRGPVLCDRGNRTQPPGKSSRRRASCSRSQAGWGACGQAAEARQPWPLYPRCL
jgi:hypothetical protein